MNELATSQEEFTNFHAQFMNETKVIFQTQSEQLKSLDIQVGQMAKILSKGQKESLPTLDEHRRVEVDSMELHELVVKEEGLTSSTD